MKPASFLQIYKLLRNDDTIRQLAQSIPVTESEMLFSEGDQPEYLYLHQSGKCMLSCNAQPVGEAQQNTALDLLATLGGEAHSQRAIALTDCTFLRWELDLLWQNPEFAQAVGHDLGIALQKTERRLEQLQAPVRYQPHSAQVYPGPFVFPDSTILFVFCTLVQDHIRLPAGVSRIGRGLLLGIADFSGAYYHYQPDARFSYTETTFFVPVRVGMRLGLYVPYIYPSTYEPILLGREIYGFPKQLGQTTLSAHSAALSSVTGEEYLSVDWDTREKNNEARIVGAFGQLFGVTGRVTTAAFSVGDLLLSMMNVPFYRRVSVFNHKRIPGTETRQGKVMYDVDQLTQAMFSVESWQSIERLLDVRMRVGGIFRDWDIHLQEAFYTRLSMRLSTGKILRDYNHSSS